MSAALQNPENWPAIQRAARELRASGFGVPACGGVVTREEAGILLGEALPETVEPEFSATTDKLDAILEDANRPVIEVSSKRYDFWSRVLEFGRKLLRRE